MKNSIIPISLRQVTKKVFASLFLVCIVMFPHAGVSQTPDITNAGEETPVSCAGLSFTATSLLPEYHRANQPDSIYDLLDYWQYHCGGPEPMVRFRILYQIETNTFSDDWYPDNILALINDYKELEINPELQGNYYYWDYFHRDYLPINPHFNEYTKTLALELLKYTDLQPIEQFFLEYYANNFINSTKRFKDGSLSGTRIDSLYQQQRHNQTMAKRSYMGIYAGLWRPHGNLAILGKHPQIGFLIGSTKNRIVTNLNFNIGFGNTPNNYYVVVNNMLYTSRNFLSIHLGGDVGVEVIKTPDIALLLTTGIAYEGFDAFTVEQQEVDGMSKTIGSFNLNVGSELRIPTGFNSFLGLQVKYHLLNFRNRGRGATNLEGNAVTIGAVLGFGY